MPHTKLIDPRGTHCLLELYGCPGNILNNSTLISACLKHCAEVAHTYLINEVVHHFHPLGLTAFALLAESHIAIHTWPEHGYAAVDIFTCGTESCPIAACRFLTQELKATSHQLIEIPRGNPL